MTRWVVSPVGDLSGWTVEWLEEGRCFVSRQAGLFQSRFAALPFQKIGTFPLSSVWRGQASRLGPLQRLLRASYYNVLPLPDGTLFVTFDRAVGFVRDGGIRCLSGLDRPARVLRGACAQDTEGAIYFGEYLGNKERGPIRVYRFTPGATQLEVVHVFEAGSIRHVHGIYLDPFDQSFWCLAGDIGGEARIMRTTDSFRSLETIGGGDETWRGVSIRFRANAIYYATDAELAPNQLFRIDRRSGRRDALCPLPGPVYYSHAVGSDLFFAVSAELCPSQSSRTCSLWHIDSADACRQVVQLEKDWLPVKFFQAGTLSFPLGPQLPGQTFFGTVALSGGDRTFRLCRSAVD